jgi:rubrerythrin
VVKTTVENLQAALAGEQHEIDVMYPDFIQEAETQKNTAALRTFKFAIEAEKEHARLYSKVLDHIQHCTEKSCSKTSTAGTFYVCPVCGYTAEKAEFDRCPVCNCPKEKFELVS